MNRCAFAMVVLLAIPCAFTALPAASAQDAGSADPGVFPVELPVGGSFEVCTSGQIVCPARSAMCDDPKVAVPVDAASGLGIKGVSPGSTLCSAASAAGPRRVFRITVR